MSLKTQAQTTLDGIAPFNSGRQSLNVAESSQQVTSDLVALDALALAFEHVTLSSLKLEKAPIEQLKKVADALSKRLTYLLEPISPIEVDTDRCIVQLRSNPPQRDDNGTRYYELLVCQGGEIALHRFQKHPGGTRQSIPAQVTREVFLRLVDDFSIVAN